MKCILTDNILKEFSLNQEVYSNNNVKCVEVDICKSCTMNMHVLSHPLFLDQCVADTLIHLHSNIKTSHFTKPTNMNIQ